MPECAEDIGCRDELDASDCIQTGLKVRKGPTLADNVMVEGMTIINTEARASVLLCDKSTRAAPRAGTFFDDVPFMHIMDTFFYDSFSLRFGPVRGTIDRTGVRGQRKFCLRVRATTKL